MAPSLVTTLQVESLHSKFDELQKLYGADDFHSIYGGGQTQRPDICFVFMNPTGRNVASDPSWEGIRAPWLGTKNIWKLFYQIGLLDEALYLQIQALKPDDWTPSFALRLYQNLASHHVYITNLGKCTQEDARPLPNKVFKSYLTLLKEEIAEVQPKVIVTFGNQVSSILLNETISVSKSRRKSFPCVIDEISYPVYPVYYPVGQGMRNINTAIDDILSILVNI